MKKLFLFQLSLVIFCILTGCRSTRLATQPVREVHTDTLHLSNLRYDSIYICQEHTSDYHRGIQSNESVSSVQSVFSHPVSDTLFIHDRTVEYRYRLLRDTLYRTRIDSIPVVREVEVIREVPRPKTWFDRLCRYAFFLLSGVLLFFFYRCIRKFI